MHEENKFAVKKIRRMEVGVGKGGLGWGDGGDRHENVDAVRAVAADKSWVGW